MKKLVLYFVMVSVIAYGVFASGSGDTTTGGEKKVVWKFGHLSNGQHLWHKTAERFAQLVNEKTNGTLEIQIFPNEQLGAEVDVINDIKTGTADMTITGESLSNWAPKTALLGMPYAIKNLEHLNTVLSGPIGVEITKEISDKVGLKVLWHHKRSPRNLTSNIPIRTPADVRGLKMRVPSVPAFMMAWNAVGASPQVMAFSEVFTGLQQKVIESQENPYDLIVSASFFEVQKYVNETEHVFGWIYVVVGNKQFKSLNESQQQAVIEASAEVSQWADKQLASETEKAKQIVIDKGMQVISDVDKTAFQKLMVPAVKAHLKSDVARLLDEMVKLGN